MPNDRFVNSRWILMLAAFLAGSASPITPTTAASLIANETYGRLPLHFEANRGQTHEDVRFLARGPGYSLYLTAGEAVLVLARPNPDAKRDAHSTPERLNTPEREAPVVVRMSLVGAAPKPRVSGLEELPGKANYFIGNNPAKWQTSARAALFFDYGNVFSTDNVRYLGRDLTTPVNYKFKYDQLKKSAGISVQWLAPSLGVFRFSYGIPLNKYAGDAVHFADRTETFQFTIGGSY